MRRVLPTMIFAGLTLLGMPACTDVEPQPGQKGGACRVSLQPCDTGLLCVSGGCNRPPGEQLSPVNVQWSFPPMGKDAVQADGFDELFLQALLLNRETGEPMPQNFGFRMWVEPPTAGTLTILRDFNPLHPEMQYSLTDDQGRALARFVGCNKDEPGCQRYASVRIAVEPRPLAAIDAVTIENIGAGAAVSPGPVDPEDPGNTVTPPLPDGFGPAERCDGALNSLYVEGGEGSAVFRGAETVAITNWFLRNGLPPEATSSMILQIETEELGAIRFTISTRELGENFTEREYPDVTSVNSEREGSAAFDLFANDSALGNACPPAEQRRFAIQSYVQEGSSLKRLAVSFVHGCGGGILQGCFVIEPIE